MNTDLQISLIRTGRSVSCAGLGPQHENVWKVVWPDACQLLIEQHPTEAKAIAAEEMELLVLCEWPAGRLARNLATHWLVVALEQYLGLEPTSIQEQGPATGGPAAALVGRLTLSSADPSVEAGRTTVCVERMRAGRRDYFQNAALPERGMGRLVTGIAKMLARRVGSADNEGVGELEGIGGPAEQALLKRLEKARDPMMALELLRQMPKSKPVVPPAILGLKRVLVMSREAPFTNPEEFVDGVNAVLRRENYCFYFPSDGAIARRLYLHRSSSAAGNIQYRLTTGAMRGFLGKHQSTLIPYARAYTPPMSKELGTKDPTQKND